jgi:hypothetical protein
MRAVVVSSLLILLACGGSKKPAESASETPSTESSSSSSSETTPPESADSSASAASASTAGAPAESASSEAAPAPSSSGSSGPNITGAIDGKPFVPKMARITHPMQKDGRILLTLDEHLACGGAGDANQGEGIMTMMVTWEDGYKVDLGSLKRAGKKGGGEISFARVGAHGKKDVSTTFKPTGRVTVVKAPMEQNGIGKVNIDLQSGEYMLSGDLDVQACVAPKSAHAQTAAKKKK